MRLLISLILAGLIILLFGSCATQRHANTVVTEDSACIVNMVIQIGIMGHDSDVNRVRQDLEPCFTKECYTPCPAGKTGGCRIKAVVIVKKWSTLTDDEKSSFHAITMVDNDGLPSNAWLGKVNEGASSGTWRRNAHPHTYCHETLHLLGLEDQYCSRIYNAVDGTITTELTCKNGNEPNGGTCCTPTPQHTRCSSTCEGHEHDLMATLTPELSCDNLNDVLKQSGQGKCPDQCCKDRPSYSSFSIGPSYLHFGDKEVDINSIGATVGYDYQVKPKLGIKIEASYQIKTENLYSDVKYVNNFLSIGAGISYKSYLNTSKDNLRLSTQLLAGIMNWGQKFKFGSETSSESQTSFMGCLGAALDWKIGPKTFLRLPQVDYMPTFFAESTQHNYRLGGSLVVGLGK